MSKQLVTKAGSLLEAHEVGGISPVMRLWKGVTWKIVQNTSWRPYQLDAEGVILLYANLTSEREPERWVLQAFGDLLLAAAGPTAQNQWAQLLDKPSTELVATINAKLRSKTEREGLDTYAAFVGKFKTPYDKFVAMNFANALMKNGVPFGQSQGIDLTNYGPTQEYATGMRSHSLKSFEGYTGYAGNFGAAFADWVKTDLKGTRDSSIQEALRRIIKKIIEQVH